MPSVMAGFSVSGLSLEVDGEERLDDLDINITTEIINTNTDEGPIIAQNNSDNNYLSVVDGFFVHNGIPTTHFDEGTFRGLSRKTAQVLGDKFYVSAHSCGVGYDWAYRDHIDPYRKAQGVAL